MTHALLFLFSAVLPALLEAAPQKRNCHSTTPPSWDPVSSSIPVSAPFATTVSTSNTISVLDFSSNPNLESSTYLDSDSFSPTSSFFTDNPASITGVSNSIDSDSDSDSDEFSTLITAMSMGSVPPKIILVYPNTTISLSQSNIITISHLDSRTTTPSRPQTFRTTTMTTTTTPRLSTTPTTTSRTPVTTPNMGAMQTAYYLDVCSWEEHADDAICLSANTMMCCRANNPNCQAVLEDGGLSCQGIESGAWATKWARPTVTVTVGGGSSSSVADDSLMTTQTTQAMTATATEMPSSITGVNSGGSGNSPPVSAQGLGASLTGGGTSDTDAITVVPTESAAPASTAPATSTEELRVIPIPDFKSK